MIITMLATAAVLIVAGAIIFLNRPSFGRLPRGERLERIERSPNYRNGAFQNRHSTPVITSHKSRWRNMVDFLFRDGKSVRPDRPVPAIRTDLHALDRNRDCLVWFGHSSYLLQLDGKRYLIDPVFYSASPVSFVNRPFPGTDLYRPEDMPDIDFLVISHDHWDHLDYATVKALKTRVGKVVCPLGVGAHFERWGFAREQLVELDWDEEYRDSGRLILYCLPARHFSGRGLKANRTLWASFLIETPERKVYLGGDGGYDTHFREIGTRFPGIDLAILENGQYSENWKYIHLMPQFLTRAATDLGARRILTVHHSKYALSTHPWDEPLRNEEEAARNAAFRLIRPMIGEVVVLE